MSSYLPPPDDLLTISERLLDLCPTEKWHKRALSALSGSSCDSIGIACSGGADSTFALLLVYAAFPDLRDRMFVLHYNHNLRECSREDERFVVKMAKSLDLPHEIGKSEEETRSDEGSLRERRLGFIFDISEKRKFSCLVQGHNRDDVAETILWRLSRGSGPQGLCSPRPAHQHGSLCIARPFITIDRTKIRAMLAEANMIWREDESNNSVEYLRNRIRKNSLQRLKEDVDRDLLHGVSRSRDLLEEQEDAIEEWTGRAMDRCLCEDSIDLRCLSEYPLAIKRRVVLNWLTDRESAFVIRSTRLDQILQSIECGQEIGVSLSSRVTVRSKDSRLILGQPCDKISGWPLCSLPSGHPLCLPGGKTLHFTSQKATDSQISQILSGKVDQSSEAYCAGFSKVQTLYARTRLPGDEYRPIGSPGRKKLKNWMIDRKLDQYSKDTLPLVLDSSGEIVWIPGFAPAQTRQVEEGAQWLIHLTYE